MFEGLLWLFTWLVVHFLLWHFKPGPMGFSALAKLSLLTGTLGAIWALRRGMQWAELTDAAGVYAFGVMLYMHWYVGVDRSVSIRVLNELTKAKNGLSLPELHRQYPVEGMFVHRLDLMVQNGWLIKENDRYRVAAKAQRLAHWTIRLRRVYNLSKAG